MSLDLSTAEILKSGMECLTDKLGVINAERFIATIIREQLDYTKWQKDYFDNMTSEEFNDKLLNYAEKHPHKGNAKTIL